MLIRDFGLFCKTSQHFLTFICNRLDLRLTVFAFSDNLSAEHYKLSAKSGLQGLSLLGCMKNFYEFRMIVRKEKLSHLSVTFQWRGGNINEDQSEIC